MSKDADIKVSKDDSLLCVFRNCCGEYELHLVPDNEKKGSRLEVCCVPRVKADDTARVSSTNEKYVPVSDWHERALPYLQALADDSRRGGDEIMEILDKLERFGNHHYCPLPWPVEPLPEGAIY